MRGYFGIGIYNAKTTYNIGSLWRSAQNFGAQFIFTIGKRYKNQSSDTTKAFRHIPLFNFDTFEEFQKFRPKDCKLIGIEQSDKSRDIRNFVHPERSIYLLGSEDGGLPPKVQNKCQDIVHISTPMCINVAVAGSIIMYDRSIK